MIYENDVFTADNPASFDVTEWGGKQFRATDDTAEVTS